MGCRKNLLDKRFNKLVVKKFLYTNHYNRAIWLCECDCGKITNVSTDSLTTNNTQSCGCYKSKRTTESHLQDLSNKEFGYWRVIERATAIGIRKVKWKCICKCGKIFDVYGFSLKSGKSKMCKLCCKKRGSNAPNWNPLLTEEMRKKGRRIDKEKISIWRKNIFHRDSYRCVICHKNKSGKLNAHHLNGWNSHPNERFDLDNGVTLCINCHKVFHNIYGFGNNTKKQFLEFQGK